MRVGETKSESKRERERKRERALCPSLVLTLDSISAALLFITGSDQSDHRKWSSRSQEVSDMENVTR